MSLDVLLMYLFLKDYDLFIMTLQSFGVKTSCMKKILLLLILFMSFTLVGEQSKQSILETVVDEDREILLAAKILVKGTSTDIVNHFDDLHRINNSSSTLDVKMILDTYSVKINNGQTNNSIIKKDLFEEKSIMPNQEYDLKVESTVSGAILNVLAFSNSATDGVSAVLHKHG